MPNDTNLQFIREKISQLRNAVMYVSCSGPLKLGNNVVTAVKVDEEGQLWFLANYPPQLAEECEQSFPARLSFCKKGVQFFMEISGKATIVNNNYSYDQADPGKENGSQNFKKILVKLDMTNIEYTEPYAKRPKSKIELLIEGWYSWFLRTLSVPHDSGSVLKKLRQTG
jgi:hypothetical protein